MFEHIATCIHCGCDDIAACISEEGIPCHWLRVDYDAGIGICSECGDPLLLAVWDETYGEETINDVA